MAKFKLQWNNEIREFEATRQGDELHLTSGDQTAVLRLLAHNETSLTLEYTAADGSRQPLRISGHTAAELRQLWVNGRTLTLQKVRERGSASSNTGSLAATIPGVVTAILVNPGDQVFSGDKLILLESMKMVIPIQAPVDGLVTAVHCAVGDPVQAGIQLIDLEPTGEGTTP
jgi:biotin carboxyl carrier protein